MSQVARLSEEVRRLKGILTAAAGAATLPAATLKLVPGPPIQWTAALAPQASGLAVAVASEPLYNLGAPHEEGEGGGENGRVGLGLWHAPPLL
jgi:hypothetical protein